MQRQLFLIAAMAAVLLTPADALAGRRLAVGAAAGYAPPPPGYEIVPVFTRPVGSAWTPADTSLGYSFREPIYSTPKGYKYVYVRGYTLRRVAVEGAPVVKRVVVKRVHVKKTSSVRRYRGPCVTDIGYGRHEYCN